MREPDQFAKILQRLEQIEIRIGAKAPKTMTEIEAETTRAGLRWFALCFCFAVGSCAAVNL